MLKGQELMCEFIGNMIYEREECVSIKDFLIELSKTIEEFPEEDRLEIRLALFGDKSF